MEDSENVRLKRIGVLYGLKEYKKWCSQRMFLLGVCAMLLPMLLHVRPKGTSFYKFCSTTAVSKGIHYDVRCPSDLPDSEIDNFILTYRIGETMFKLYRQSAVVPVSVRRLTFKKQQTIRSVNAVDSLGNITTVTDELEEYGGGNGNFHGNDLSLPELVHALTGIDFEMVLVERCTRWNGWLDVWSVFDPACWISTLDIHTNINIISL